MLRCRQLLWTGLQHRAPAVRYAERFLACSAFARATACTLALSPIRDTHSEGFSYFVTSIAALAASGWSVRRVGLAPTGKRRLITAHTRFGHACRLANRHLVVHLRCDPRPTSRLLGRSRIFL